MLFPRDYKRRRSIINRKKKNHITFSMPLAFLFSLLRNQFVRRTRERGKK